ncbi:hypothetical protein [Lysinibacillus sp. 54212]|uniref:hypothetical protein n=1 Tax=Lysinibacillus sp. 54212 TaxID=3119829 RepID=UPI002FCBFFDC
MRRFNASNTRLTGKQTNVTYLKQFEKRGLDGQIAASFESTTVQQRYNEIITALKYTKHNKKKAKLLKAKRMYEGIMRQGA